MIQMKNDLIESCSSNLLFIIENQSQEDQVDIVPQKLTLVIQLIAQILNPILKGASCARFCSNIRF